MKIIRCRTCGHEIPVRGQTIPLTCGGICPVGQNLPLAYDLVSEDVAHSTSDVGRAGSPDQAPAPGRGSGESIGEPAGPMGAGGSVRATPAAIALAEEHGVDLDDVVPSGVGGSVTRADVAEYLGDPDLDEGLDQADYTGLDYDPDDDVDQAEADEEGGQYG